MEIQNLARDSESPEGDTEMRHDVDVDDQYRMKEGTKTVAELEAFVNSTMIEVSQELCCIATSRKHTALTSTP